MALMALARRVASMVHLLRLEVGGRRCGVLAVAPLCVAGGQQRGRLIAYVLLLSSHRCYSLRMALTVDWDEGALAELRGLPVAERGAVMNAIAKLEAFGDQLGWPHTSQVKGSRFGIRELRPRAGRSGVEGAVPAGGRRHGCARRRPGSRA